MEMGLHPVSRIDNSLEALSGEKILQHTGLGLRVLAGTAGHRQSGEIGIHDEGWPPKVIGASV